MRVNNNWNVESSHSQNADEANKSIDVTAIEKLPGVQCTVRNPESDSQGLYLTSLLSPNHLPYDFVFLFCLISHCFVCLHSVCFPFLLLLSPSKTSRVLKRSLPLLNSHHQVLKSDEFSSYVIVHK